MNRSVSKLQFLFLLAALLAGPLAAPAAAMTEQSATSTTPSAQSQYADPDDAEEKFSDGTSHAGALSGREQELLGVQDSGQYSYGAGNGGAGFYGSAGSGSTYGLGAHGGYYGR